MSVNWQCGECEAYKEAKKFDEESDEWKTFCNLRYTLAMILVGTEFPTGPWIITKENWEAVFTRVHIWEQVLGSMRVGMGIDSDTEKETKYDIFFTPEEIYSMIGFGVNAGNKTDAKFKLHVYQVMERKAQVEIQKYFA